MQDHLHKAQGLKDFKVASSVHNNMRTMSAELRKGDSLARLVGKAHPCARVSKQMRQTAAQHDRQDIKHDLTIAG